MTGELKNPVTRECFTIRDCGPESLVLEVRVPPDMIRPPLHLHCGQLSITSQPRKGTTVQFDLPNRQAKATSPPVEKATA